MHEIFTVCDEEVQEMRIKVFVAGPYTEAQTEPEVERPGLALDLNVGRAVRMAEKLFKLGYVPFIPHLFHFWHFGWHKHDRIEWMKMDLEWLMVCDAVYRMEGKSKGADREVAVAKINRIPVYHNTDDLLRELPPR